MRWGKVADNMLASKDVYGSIIWINREPFRIITGGVNAFRFEIQDKQTKGNTRIF